MADLTKEEVVKTMTDIAVLMANQIADEEIRRFEKENPNELVEQDIKALVKQRCLSELMFRTCNYKKDKEITTVQDLETDFKKWIAMEEEQKLRNMCHGCIRTELNKRYKPGEENLTFTERYLRKVKEQQKNHASNVASLMSDLNNK